MVADIVAQLPNEYGYVVASSIFSFLVVGLGLTGPVMAGRKMHGVPYPTMYATAITLKDGTVATNAKDGDSAAAFNCVQRGHQNALETHYAMMVFALVGGLAAPVVAAAGLAAWSVGSYFYARNYRNGGAKSRYGNLAPLRIVGNLVLLYPMLLLTYQLLTK